MKRLFLQLGLVLALAGLARAQAPPITTSQATFPVNTNMTPVASALPSVVGNPGTRTLYYWVEANYTLGGAAIGGPFIVFNAPNTLSGSNYVQVVPVYPSGVLNVDLLRTTTSVPPTGACNCAVATAVAPGSAILDQSNSLNGYTVSTIDPSTLSSTLTNEVTAAGQAHLMLRQNGTLIQDLFAITGGIGNVSAGGTLANGQPVLGAGGHNIASGAINLAGGPTIVTGITPPVNGGTGSSTTPGAAQIAVGNAGGTAYAPVSLSQDCTITSLGVITCTRTNNVLFSPSATTDATNASNIGSGTLAGARMSPVNLASSGNGGVTGNLPSINLGGGTGAGPTTFLRGDMTWQTPAGAGNISNTGTPTAGQSAVFTSATVIQGVTQGVGGRTVAGASDTILCDTGTVANDRLTTILYTSASAVSVTLPQAGSAGCANNFAFTLVSQSANVTVTPTTSTISSYIGSRGLTGQTSLVIPSGGFCSFSSPDNTNYIARCSGLAPEAGYGLNAADYTANTSTDMGRMIRDALASPEANNVGPTVRIPTRNAGAWAMNTDPFAGSPSQNGCHILQQGVTINTDVTIAPINKCDWIGTVKGDIGGVTGTGSAIAGTATWRSNFPAVFSASSSDTLCFVTNGNTLTAGTNVAGTCTAGAVHPFTSNLVGYVAGIFPSGTSNPAGLIQDNWVPIGIVQTFTDDQHVNVWRNIQNPITIPSNGTGYQYGFIRPLGVIGTPTASGCPTGTTCIGNQQRFENMTFECGDNNTGTNGNLHIGLVNIYGQEQEWWWNVGTRNCAWESWVIASTGTQDSGPYSGIVGGATGATSTSIPVFIWQPGYFHGIAGNTTLNTGITERTNIQYTNTVNQGGVDFMGIHVESATDGITCGDLVSWPWASGGTGCKKSTFSSTSTASTVTNAIHFANSAGVPSADDVVRGTNGTATNCILDDIHGGQTIGFTSCGPEWYLGAPVFSDGLKVTNATSGVILIQAPTGALGTPTLTLPTGTGVLADAGDGTIFASAINANGSLALTAPASGTVLGNPAGVAAVPTYTTTPVLGLAGTTSGQLDIKSSGSATNGLRLTDSTISTLGTNEAITISPSGTGAVVFNDGAVATPSIGFAGDTTTGFLDNSTVNHTIAVSTNGVSVMEFDASGVRGSSVGQWRWSSGGVGTAADTGISRDTADIIDFGNGTQGNSSALFKSGMTVSVTADFTTAANTNLQTITGLSWTVPATGTHNFSYWCDGAYSQATANAAVAFGIQAATNAPTNIFGEGALYTSTSALTTGVLATLNTTTATNIVSATPSATATNFIFHLQGRIENPATTANTFNIMVSTATSGDAVTVKRGSSCHLGP
jgi:hypothetical protein